MELWYPRARIWRGPAWKIRGGTHTSLRAKNSVSGVVMHSAVGYLGGLHDVLWDPDRAAAWPFSVLQDGVVEQHYALDEVLYHAGSKFAHNHLVGIENEGGFSPVSEPFTAAQREAAVDLVRWIAEQGGFRLVRASDGRTLHEHNEVTVGSTSCPNGRIPWDALTEEEEMSNAYIVEPGDTLSGIARRFSTSVEFLSELNGLVNPNAIEPGQVLRLDRNAPQPRLGTDIEEQLRWWRDTLKRVEATRHGVLGAIEVLDQRQGDK